MAAHRTEISGYRHLNETQIRMIAARYDLDPNSSVVRENAAQADDNHGKPCAGFNGDLRRFWGCDATGHYDACNLLDGYLCEETRVARCDALAHADFCVRAY